MLLSRRPRYGSMRRSTGAAPGSIRGASIVGGGIGSTPEPRTRRSRTPACSPCVSPKMRPRPSRPSTEAGEVDHREECAGGEGGTNGAVPGGEDPLQSATKGQFLADGARTTRPRTRSALSSGDRKTMWVTSYRVAISSPTIKRSSIPLKAAANKKPTSIT